MFLNSFIEKQDWDGLIRRLGTVLMLDPHALKHITRYVPPKVATRCVRAAIERELVSLEDGLSSLYCGSHVKYLLDIYTPEVVARFQLPIKTKYFWGLMDSSSYQIAAELLDKLIHYQYRAVLNGITAKELIHLLKVFNQKQTQRFLRDSNSDLFLQLLNNNELAVFVKDYLVKGGISHYYASDMKAAILLKHKIRLDVAHLAPKEVLLDLTNDPEIKAAVKQEVLKSNKRSQLEWYFENIEWDEEVFDIISGS